MLVVEEAQRRKRADVRGLENTSQTLKLGLAGQVVVFQVDVEWEEKPSVVKRPSTLQELEFFWRSGCAERA